MGLIADIKKYYAIKNYLRKLPASLEAIYGKLATYTPRQIRSSVEVEGLNESYIRYALSIFSDAEMFAEAMLDQGEKWGEYSELRSEVSAYFFSCADFGEIEIAQYVADNTPDSSDSGGWGDSDSDGGGDGGGD